MPLSCGYGGVARGLSDDLLRRTSRQPIAPGPYTPVRVGVPENLIAPNIPGCAGTTALLAMPTMSDPRLWQRAIGKLGFDPSSLSGHAGRA